MKTTIFAFCRMNPPSSGHAELIDKLHQLAGKYQAEHLIVLTKTHDAELNPLTPEQKINYLRKLFPNTNFQLDDNDRPDPWKNMQRLYKAGTENLIVLAGWDRRNYYIEGLKALNGEGKMFNFKTVNLVVNQRKVDASGTNRVSASQLRLLAKNNNFEEFRMNIPSNDISLAKQLFDDVRAGMLLS